MLPPKNSPGSKKGGAEVLRAPLLARSRLRRQYNGSTFYTTLYYSTRRFARPLQYIVEAQAHHICYGSPTRKKIQMRDAKVAKIYSTRLNEAQNETSTKNI